MFQEEMLQPISFTKKENGSQEKMKLNIWFLNSACLREQVLTMCI